MSKQNYVSLYSRKDLFLFSVFLSPSIGFLSLTGSKKQCSQNLIQTIGIHKGTAG